MSYSDSRVGLFVSTESVAHDYPCEGWETN